MEAVPLPEAAARALIAGNAMCRTLRNGTARLGAELGSGKEGTVRAYEPAQGATPPLHAMAVKREHHPDPDAMAIGGGKGSDPSAPPGHVRCTGFCTALVCGALATEAAGPAYHHVMRLLGANHSASMPCTTFLERVDGTLGELIRSRMWDGARHIASAAFAVLYTIRELQQAHRMVHHDLHVGNVFYQRIDDRHPLRAYAWFAYALGDGGLAVLPNPGFVVKIGDFGHARCSAYTDAGSRVRYSLYGADVGRYGGMRRVTVPSKRKRGSTSSARGVVAVQDWGVWNTEFSRSYDAQFFASSLDHAVNEHSRDSDVASRDFAAALLAAVGGTYADSVGHTVPAPDAWRGPECMLTVSRATLRPTTLSEIDIADVLANRIFAEHAHPPLDPAIAARLRAGLPCANIYPMVFAGRGPNSIVSLTTPSKSVNTTMNVNQATQ